MDVQQNLNQDLVDCTNPRPPLCVEPATTVFRVLQLLKEQEAGGALICQANQVVGIFTERDVLRVLAEGTDLGQPVSSVMTASPAVVQRTETVATAITRMAKGSLRRLPIIDEAGKPTGIVNVTGVLQYLVEYFPKVVYTLPPKPHHSTQDREGA